MAALLSLLIKKHGQKGIVILTCVELIQVVLKDVKNKRGKNERCRSCSQVKKHLSDYLALAVKSSGDISAEPVKGQKIEEHVVTDLDLRNDENRPSLTSSAAAEKVKIYHQKTRQMRWLTLSLEATISVSGQWRFLNEKTGGPL